MYNLQKIQKLIKKIVISVDELHEQLNVYDDKIKLSSDDDWIMQAISNESDPAFKCDILKTSDIIAALTRLSPTIGEKLTLVKMGKILSRIGRYQKVRGLNGTQTHRLWVLKNFQDHVGQRSTVIWKSYQQQLRDNLLLPDEEGKLGAKLVYTPCNVSFI